MKIDLVYMWVDGGDPRWTHRKNAALAAAGKTIQAGAKRATLWNEQDELKYSLRSARKFAPWINHIYIITDRQRPDWLADNPKITIVDHMEIVPGKYLPLFNSAALDMFVQNIPELSEHYLLANDDFFFGRPVEPDFFYDKNGDPIVVAKKYNMSRAIKGLPARSMFYQTMFNAAKLVHDATGKQINIRMAHAIEPMRKSYVTETVARFHDTLMETTATTFRNKTNVQRILFPMMDAALGRNTIVSPSQRRNKNIWFLRANMFWMPATFCINGTIKLNSFGHNLPAIKALFPDKAEWEK